MISLNGSVYCEIFASAICHDFVTKKTQQSNFDFVYFLHYSEKKLKQLLFISQEELFGCEIFMILRIPEAVKINHMQRKTDMQYLFLSSCPY